jgi:hypothetical protein
MSKKKTKQLKTLSELPKDEYIAMMKELNPDLTDAELEDMINEQSNISLEEPMYAEYDSLDDDFIDYGNDY